MTEYMKDAAMGLQPRSLAEQPVASARPLHLHPLSLLFSSTLHERGFKKHQSTVWASNELRNVYLNLLCGVCNLSISNFLLVQGSMFTLQLAKLVLPYLTVAVIHWYLAARWPHWARYRQAGNLIAELCYSLICTLSMPSWVLHGAVTDAKTFLRMFTLGSGILIGYWCRFLTPTYFATARWIVPFQFAFQAWYLTEPTCNTVQASTYGSHAVRQLSKFVDSLASTMLGSCPAESCHNLMYMFEFVTGAGLLYVQYKMEASSRLAYVQGKAQLVPYWPYMPGYVQAVVHFMLAYMVCSLVWVMLQCNAV